MFEGCSELVSIDLSNCTAINQGATKRNISSYAFRNCTKLSSVIFPPEPYSIGNSTFEGTNLTSVDLSNVTEIWSSSFKDCVNLSAVTFPATDYIILNTSFQNTGLTSVDLGGVTSIGDNVFADCEELVEVLFSSPTAPALTANSFAGIDAVFYVPADGTGYDAEAFTNIIGESTPFVAPSFTVQPQSQSKTVGETASFAVVAAGTPEPVLQWQVSADGGATWTDIAGATGAALTVPATSVSLNGRKYRCTAESLAGKAESEAVLLTVKAVILPDDKDKDKDIDKDKDKDNQKETPVATSLQTLAITAADVPWTGKAVTSGLKLTAKVSGKSVPLAVGKDVTLSGFASNKNIGKATATATAKAGSAYTGSKTVTFRIIPKKLAAPKLKIGKRTIKATWKKAAKAQKVTGYKIQYRTSSAKSYKTMTIKKASTVSKVIKKLKKGKKYKVRIAAYKSIKSGASKGTYIGPWSKVKTSGKVK
jgi:hypothetical protein